MAEIKWIRMAEELQNDDGRYLTVSERGTISIDKYEKERERLLCDGSRKNGFGKFNTVFWAELPNLPEEFIVEKREQEIRKAQEEIKRLKEKIRELQGGEK